MNAILYKKKYLTNNDLYDIIQVYNKLYDIIQT